jgi:hypothetical protein
MRILRELGCVTNRETFIFVELRSGECVPGNVPLSIARDPEAFWVAEVTQAVVMCIQKSYSRGYDALKAFTYNDADAEQ